MNIFRELENCNSSDFNILKTIEELNELSLALIEHYTKEKDNIIHISEEVGDVKFRLDALVKLLGIEEQVDKRYEYKKAHLENKVMLGKLGKTVSENLKLT